METKKSITVYIFTTIPGLSDEIQQETQQRGLLGVNFVKYPLLSKGKIPPQKMWNYRLLDDEEFMCTEIKKMEYVIADTPVLVQILSRPDNLVRYAQNTLNGVEKLLSELKSLKLRPEFTLTRFGGTFFKQCISEYVIGIILNRERKFGLLHEQQEQRTYEYPKFYPFRSFDRMSIGILGAGAIGKDVLRMCKAFHATTWAVVRDAKFDENNSCNVEHADHVRPISRLKEVLSEVDYLVTLLPSTTDTKDLLSGNVLLPCQSKRTVLINVGRGDIIDETSLIEAINKGWLGGAILDVQKTEPLPSDSSLWSLPGVTITPHCSCCYRDPKDFAEDYVDNLVNLVEGKPLLHQVIFERGY